MKFSHNISFLCSKTSLCAVAALDAELSRSISLRYFVPSSSPDFIRGNCCHHESYKREIFRKEKEVQCAKFIWNGLAYQRLFVSEKSFRSRQSRYFNPVDHVKGECNSPSTLAPCHEFLSFKFFVYTILRCALRIYTALTKETRKSGSNDIQPFPKYLQYTRAVWTKGNYKRCKRCFNL